MTSFNFKRQIFLQDTDCAGIVYFAKFFDFAHEAFEAYLQEQDLPLVKILNELPFLLPITNATCSYKKPLKVSDCITIDLEMQRLSEHSIKTSCKIKNQESLEVAIVQIEHTCVSKDTWKKISIPAEILSMLN